MARLYLRDKERSVREYAKGIEGVDRPVWKTEQVKDMEASYAIVADELSEVRRKAVLAIRKHVGTALVPIYLRAVFKVWKLSKLEVPREQFVAEVNAVIAKNKIDRATLNTILRELGLPTV